MYNKLMLLKYGKYDFNKACFKKVTNRYKYLLLAIANFQISTTNFENANTICGIATSYFILEFINTFNKLELYSHETYFLNKLYNEVLNDYKTINETFNFHNPIEIYKAFCYIYKNGYLSYNHKFSYETKDLLENFDLLGNTIMTGKACCRHTSIFLNDVLKQENIKSYRVYAGMNAKKSITTLDFNPNISKYKLAHIKKVINNKDLSKEELLDILKEKFNDNIKINEEYKWEYKKNEIPMNHAINVAKYKSHSFYLDCTNDCVYQYDKKDQLLIYDDQFQSKIIFDDYDKKYNERIIQKITKLPCLTEEEIYSYEQKTITTLNNNKDILESFYNEHKDIYIETTEKLKEYMKKM